ncbi:MAG: LysM peptidoglycan-binding domain-containing protein [Anaerolineae bacterium]
MNCPKCGAALSGRPSFCSQCGHQLPHKRRVRRCPSCGMRVAETAKTCLMCGVPLEEARTLLPSFSLVSLLSLPILGALGIFIIVAAIWLLRPWESIQIVAYQTPTPTATFTSTPFPTSTPTSTSTPTPTATPTPEVFTYRVQRGDTLLSLAAKFNTTVEAIKLVNNLTGDEIQWGLDILIPLGPVGTGEGGVPEPTETVPPTGGVETYVVQSGDTLITIAAMFGTTVQALMEANDISNPEGLRAGQELIIPGGTPTPTPTKTLAPTPTNTPGSAFSAPVLLGPPDGEKFGGGVRMGQSLTSEPEVPVLLNWMAEGLLSEGEWYMVSVRYVTGAGTAQQVTELTKATSYLVPLEMRPPKGASSHLFEWDVGVVKETGTFPDGTPKVEPISPRSETRTFHWY